MECFVRDGFRASGSIRNDPVGFQRCQVGPFWERVKVKEVDDEGPIEWLIIPVPPQLLIAENSAFPAGLKKRLQIVNARYDVFYHT